MESAPTTISADLDRDPIGTYNATQEHQQRGYLNNEPTPTGAEADGLLQDADSHIKARFRHAAHKIQSKLHIGQHDATVVHPDQRVTNRPKAAPVLAPPLSTARNNDRLLQSRPEKPSGPSVKKIAAHPIDTLKMVVGRQGENVYIEHLAKTDVAHGASVNIVRACENIASSTTAEARESGLQDLEQLTKSRQDSFVRWTMDRHVQKVRRVAATKPPRKAKQDFFHERATPGDRMPMLEYGKYLLRFYLDYYGAQYIGMFEELPKPTESAIIASFERAVLTSLPYQHMFIELRHVSLWKDPGVSAMYSVGYLVLWWLNCLVPAALFALLCMVVKRRYYPPTVEDLREGLRRSEHRELTAHDISQLIEQHGTHGWVDALIEKAGPFLLAQLEDLANFLEVLWNFYEWRDPIRTKISLGMLTAISMVVLVAPLQLLVKGSQLAAGIVFFVFCPVWNRYPQYRQMLSPLKWIFWKIPTHAEWAMARLQAEAAFQASEMHHAATGGEQRREYGPDRPGVSATTDSNKSPLVVGQYQCTSHERIGRLTVTNEGVDFKQPLSKERSWQLRYEEIKVVQKVIGGRAVGTDDALIFIDMHDEEYSTASLSDRDQVFTQIIGYSQVQWQATA